MQDACNPGTSRACQGDSHMFPKQCSARDDSTPEPTRRRKGACICMGETCRRKKMRRCYYPRQISAFASQTPAANLRRLQDESAFSTGRAGTASAPDMELAGVSDGAGDSCGVCWPPSPSSAWKSTPRSRSSLYVPCSTTRPPFMSATLSASGRTRRQASGDLPADACFGG